MSIKIIGNIEAEKPFKQLEIGEFYLNEDECVCQKITKTHCLIYAFSGVRIKKELEDTIAPVNATITITRQWETE